MHTIEEIVDVTKSINFMIFKINYNYIKKTGLYPGQPELIKQLVINEGISIRELARLTKKEPSTITKSLQRLEANGYIERKSDSSDKRITKIYVTNLGKKVSNQTNEIIKKQFELYQNILNDDEIDTLYNILHKIKIELEGEIK